MLTLASFISAVVVIIGLVFGIYGASFLISLRRNTLSPLLRRRIDWSILMLTQALYWVELMAVSGALGIPPSEYNALEPFYTIPAAPTFFIFFFAGDASIRVLNRYNFVAPKWDWEKRRVIVFVFGAASVIFYALTLRIYLVFQRLYPQVFFHGSSGELALFNIPIIISLTTIVVMLYHLWIAKSQVSDSLMRANASWIIRTIVGFTATVAIVLLLVLSGGEVLFPYSLFTPQIAALLSTVPAYCAYRAGHFLALIHKFPTSI